MDENGSEYIKSLGFYQRKFRFLAVSIDLKLKIILAKMELDLPETLPEKIDMFLKARPEVDEHLAERLLEFKRCYVALDRGSPAGEADTMSVSFEGEILDFGRARQAEIDADFAEIIAELSEISDGL
jgi:hypothetical protein